MSIESFIEQKLEGVGTIKEEQIATIVEEVKESLTRNASIFLQVLAILGRKVIIRLSILLKMVKFKLKI